VVNLPPRVVRHHDPFVVGSQHVIQQTQAGGLTSRQAKAQLAREERSATKDKPPTKTPLPHGWDEVPCNLGGFTYRAINDYDLVVAERPAVAADEYCMESWDFHTVHFL
jgi:hypothetical protein